MSEFRKGDGAGNAGEQTPPKIEFPCHGYPVKIVGDAAPEYRETVLDLVEVHAPGFDRRTVEIRESSNGRFQSITVRITATGKPQLQALFDDLKQHPLVRMVL